MPSRSSRKKPTVEQVRAWLYMVISPLIERLEQEQVFVCRKEPTWHYRARRCEYLRPLSEYVDYRQAPTLQQFYRFNPQIGRAGADHDTLVGELERLATKIHAQIAGHEECRRLAQFFDEHYQGWSGAFPEQEGPCLVAEDAINWGAGKGPPDYSSMLEIWKEHGQKVVELRDLVSQADIQQLGEILQKLEYCNRDLITGLEERRDSLADQYGLPPAPVPETRALIENPRWQE